MRLNFPETSPLMSSDFIFGVATSSFQIEGQSQSRLPCIWDTFCQQKGNVLDGSNGDVACDHIELWEQDLELIQNLNVDSYRFSISWPRVMTKEGAINEIGLKFYLDLISALNKKGIQPYVTFYHWDLPQYLEDRGGWLNRDTAYEFQNYVAKVSEKLKGKVASFTTFNEPFCSAYLGYDLGVHAPGIKDTQKSLIASHHILLAHGLAMKTLKQICPETPAGMVLNLSPCYPNSDSEEDIKAANAADIRLNHWYLGPIINGQYPELPDCLTSYSFDFIEENDLDIISHEIDFLGINYYSPGYFQHDDVSGYRDVPPSQGPLTDMGWQVQPQSLKRILVDLTVAYDLPPIYITENGAAFADELNNGTVNDTDRISYFQGHLQAVEEAIGLGIDIRGYFAWSLMDNFEWAFGYTKRFGLIYVDYATQARIPKASYLALAALLDQKRQLADIVNK